MELRRPALDLKWRLILLMALLLILSVGAQTWVSIHTQNEIVESTQKKVKDLARAIQISVEELTAVSAVDRSKLPNYVHGLDIPGLEVSIASKENLVVNSSDPSLVGAELKMPPPGTHRSLHNPFEMRGLGLGMPATTSVYQIPVKVEDHLLGYVVVTANFGDFAAPLERSRIQAAALALVIFLTALVFAYVLADRYVDPILNVANAARSLAARGLEPVPETGRRDEIGILTRSFNEMVLQLRRAREREQELNRLERFTALGQLAGGLAHEIKNPLNFISLALDQLRARYGSQLTENREAYQRQLQVMKDEIRRLTELIQTFLNYGKPIEIHPAPTDLHRLVEDVLELSESKMRSQGIEVVEEGRDVPGFLNVDAEKLRTCFVNVVANATQAMPDGGALRIGFERNDGRLSVRFSDSGSGIDPDVVRRVFEPFFTTKREGIGLGLFLSKTIVEKHGGTITISPNEPGPGTTVTFTFPAGGTYKQL